MTLDEWIDEHAAGLKDELATHIEQMLGPTEQERRDEAVRMCMVSIRQWAEDYIPARE